MTEDTRAPGCRDIAIITGLLLVAAAVLVAIGLGAINRDSCVGLCETVGLTALYAGGPVSAIFGVAWGGVHLAWPLDVTFWVVLGFAAARWSGPRQKSPWAVGVVLIIAGLVMGLVLSQFVELDISG